MRNNPAIVAPTPLLITQLLITPEQYSEGYFELRNGIAYNRSYVKIRKRDDGNYIVQQPK